MQSGCSFELGATPGGLLRPKGGGSGVSRWEGRGPYSGPRWARGQRCRTQVRTGTASSSGARTGKPPCIFPLAGKPAAPSPAPVRCHVPVCAVGPAQMSPCRHPPCSPSSPHPRSWGCLLVCPAEPERPLLPEGAGPAGLWCALRVCRASVPSTELFHAGQGGRGGSACVGTVTTLPSLTEMCSLLGSWG